MRFFVWNVWSHTNWMFVVTLCNSIRVKVILQERRQIELLPLLLLQGNFTPSEGFRPRVLTSMTWRLTPGQVTLASDWSILSILTSYWSGFFPSLRHCRVAHGAVADGDTLYVTGGSAKVKLYTMRFK